MELQVIDLTVDCGERHRHRTAKVPKPKSRLIIRYYYYPIIPIPRNRYQTNIHLVSNCKWWELGYGLRGTTTTATASLCTL